MPRKSLRETISTIDKLLDDGARCDVELPSDDGPGGFFRLRSLITTCALIHACFRQTSLPILEVLLRRHKKDRPLRLNEWFNYRERSNGCEIITSVGAAIQGENLPGLRLLLANGADPGAPCMLDTIVRHPLKLVMDRVSDVTVDMSTLVDMTCALLDAGADVNAASGSDGYQMLSASMSGWTASKTRLHPTRDWSALPLLLIARGADVNAIAPLSRFRPMDLAASAGLVDVMEALVAKGADPRPVPILAALVRNISPGGATGAMRRQEHPDCWEASSTYLDLAMVQGATAVIRFATKHGVDLNSVLKTIPNIGRVPLLTHALFLPLVIPTQ